MKQALRFATHFMPHKDEGFYRPEPTTSAQRRAVTLSREPVNNEDAADELDERAAALEAEPEEDEPQFLRAQKRVPVRRGPVNRKTANRLKIAVIAFAALAATAAAGTLLYGYGTGSWRFRLDSSDNLQINGTQNVSRRQVLQVFGADIGRNIFFIPLEERQKQLQAIPWVESATVMRLLPNTLRVRIVERTPVAFIRFGSKVALIDANGVVMDMPPHGGHHYSFPVIIGSSGNEPVSTLSARMATYSRLVQDLDSGGAHYSQALSEVDLNDPEDVKATFADPDGAVLLHLGQDHFLDRYKLYLAHVNEWRQQYPHLDSVDLRYDRQVIVNPDSQAAKAAAQQSGSRAASRLTTKRH